MKMNVHTHIHTMVTYGFKQKTWHTQIDIKFCLSAR